MNLGFILEGELVNRNLNLTCTGIIPDYDSFKAFKTVLFEIAQTDEIEHMKRSSFDTLEIKFIDAHPLPDDVVGLFLKLSQRDKIGITITTNENKMLSFFISIFLDEKFNVKLFL